jgi:hypothetical protein
MSFQPIKTGLKYFSAWSLVALFVALLTIVFSFLGTVFCAALGGMMMGATRASLKMSLPFSMLCPGLLLAILRFQKSELANRQILILLVVCLMAFWVICAVSAALMAHEQKDSNSSGNPKADTNGQLSTAACSRESSSPIKAEPRQTEVATAATLGFQLRELDGHWCCETSGLDGRTRKRTLEIKGGAVLLSTLDAEGHVCACTRANLKCTEADLALLAVSSATNPAEFLFAGHQI